jgi:hypothetical protein
MELTLGPVPFSRILADTWSAYSKQQHQLKLSSNGPQCLGCGVSTSDQLATGDWWNLAEVCDIGYGTLKRTQQRLMHANARISYDRSLRVRAVDGRTVASVGHSQRRNPRRSLAVSARDWNRDPVSRWYGVTLPILAQKEKYFEKISV